MISNEIHSFATARLRTDKTKGCGTRLATLTMVFKLTKETQKAWHKIKGYKLIPLVLKGATFVDGELPEEDEQVAQKWRLRICGKCLRHQLLTIARCHSKKSDI